jgi:peptide/nickel transport system substrate-binding protein
VVATDPHSLTIRWKNINIFGNAMGLETNMVPYPRHKLGALWEAGDKQAFANSPYLADEYVGLGPYKLREWLRGSYIEAEAFDEYFEGRPKVDRLSMRFVGDTNTLVVMFMAGELDVIPVGSLKAAEADSLKKQYEAAGTGRVIVSDAKLRQGMPQLRDPEAVWARDARVRQALTLLIDRTALAETVQFGLAAVDDITLQRTDPAYQLAKQRGLPKLDFDANQAHRLLAEAGLTRAADGTYRTQAGTPFSLELSTTNDIQTNVLEMLAIANAWKQAGVQVDNVLIPGTANKDEMRNKLRGINLTSSDLAYKGFESFITSQVATEQGRWRGDNITGWSNAAFDDSYRKLLGTINGAERSQIAADLVKTLLDQILYIPLTYSGDVSAVSKSVGGVTGVMRPQPVTVWNVHTWEMN